MKNTTENNRRKNKGCFSAVVVVVIIMFIVAMGYDFYNINLCENHQIFNDLGTFVACQITLSSVIVSIFGFILSGLDACYMGVSTKAIAFKDLVFQVNAVQCLWIVIITDVTGMFMYLFGLQLATVWCLGVSIVILMYYINMVYDLISKRSRIFFKIWKKLDEKEDKLLKYLYERIREMSCGMGKTYKTDNVYYIEDLITLFLVQKNMNGSEEDKKIIDKMGKKILEENLPDRKSMFEKAWENKWEHYIKNDELKYYTGADELVDAKDWCDKLKEEITNHRIGF